MVARKLPPYPELKQLILPERLGGRGLTYREVALIYDCNIGAVRHRFVEDAKAVGEWPVPNDWRAKQLRGMTRKRRVPAYEELLWDYLIDGLTYEELARRHGIHSSAVYVALKKGTLDRGLAWPLPVDRAARRRRHRERYVAYKDQRMKAIGVLFVVDEYLAAHDISAVELCRRAGVQPQYIHSMRTRLRKNVDAQMDKLAAGRLMRAMDEQLRTRNRDLARRRLAA